MDKVIGNNGEKLIEFIENKGWRILNGNMIGDREGYCTYIGPKGATVIDYVIVNEAAWDKTVRFEVVGRIES